MKDEHRRDPAMKLLDQGVVAACDELAMTRRPIGTAKPGFGRTH